MTQPETITLYTLEDAREIIFHSCITNIKKALITTILTAFVIALGIAIMCFVEGTMGIFTIITGLNFIYKS